MIQVLRNNTVKLTRGDTLLLRVELTVDGAAYVPEPGDSIRFALRRDDMDIKKTAFRDSSTLIVKDIPTDTLLLRLNPEDTKALPFGEYVYDIQLTRDDGFVNTFIADSRFELLREVE